MLKIMQPFENKSPTIIIPQPLEMDFIQTGDLFSMYQNSFSYNIRVKDRGGCVSNSYVGLGLHSSIIYDFHWIKDANLATFSNLNFSSFHRQLISPRTWHFIHRLGYEFEISLHVTLLLIVSKIQYKNHTYHRSDIALYFKEKNIKQNCKI